MLVQSIDPFISDEDVVSNLFTLLLLEPGIGLGLDHLLEKSRINSPDDIDEELS